MAFTLTYSFEVADEQGKLAARSGSVTVPQDMSVASLKDAMTHATHDGFRGIAAELLVVADKPIGKAH